MTMGPPVLERVARLERELAELRRMLLADREEQLRLLIGDLAVWAEPYASPQQERRWREWCQLRERVHALLRRNRSEEDNLGYDVD